MTDGVETATSLKAMYEQLPEPKVSYKVWLKKLHRLAAGNTRTINSTTRNLGLAVKRKKAPVIPGNFVAYDGEGWGNKYVLLANSHGESISNPDGLSTLDCLELLSQKYASKYVRVFFAFGYDVNHILKDVPDELLSVLLAGQFIDYHGYRLQYIPGKLFLVNNIKYFDVFGFFQTSFIKVVKTMLGETAVSNKLIEGKEARGTFETWDMDKIIEYNEEELDLLVQIMNKLREAFHTIGTDLNEWYGPGAVAKYWFKKYNVVLKEKYDPNVLTALSKAYYGGRFEQVKLGTMGPIYEYDIHSAYPAAMVDMPHFLSWKKVQQYKPTPYSIWFVSFDFREHFKDDIYDKPFLPLPMRSRDGRICFPIVGRGWYWNSELDVAIRNFPKGKITYHQGYVATTEGRPFHWIRDLYDYRAELKRSGDLAHYAIKVGLNSLYGKTAQRIGRSTHFSLAWAGYITSTTRAKLADAAYNSPASVVGFATDALFTTQRLELPISDNLGDWEQDVYDSGTFFQSGVYRVLRDNKPTDRYRGAPLRRGIDNIIEQLKEHPYDYPAVKVGRFVGHLLAIRAPNAYMAHRLSFVQVPFELKLDAPYKRHYMGFLEYKNGKFVRNFKKLLREPILSIPKMWVDDYNYILWNEYLWDHAKFQNVESYPPPLKDAVLQRLIEEGVLIAAEEGGYTNLSDLDDLPIVKDETL